MSSLSFTARADGATRLSCEQVLRQPIDEVFAFHADAHNLEKITPPFLHFRILSVSTPTVCRGTLIDYRLRLHGLALRWRSRIEDWRPPHRFCDRQLHGPYALWHHTHEFAPHSGGTLVRDVVLYRLPLGSFGAALASGLVRRDLESIFRYRQQATQALLDAQPPPASDLEVLS